MPRWQSAGPAPTHHPSTQPAARCWHPARPPDAAGQPSRPTRAPRNAGRRPTDGSAPDGPPHPDRPAPPPGSTPSRAPYRRDDPAAAPVPQHPRPATAAGPPGPSVSGCPQLLPPASDSRYLRTTPGKRKSSARQNPQPGTLPVWPPRSGLHSARPAGPRRWRCHAASRPRALGLLPSFASPRWKPPSLRPLFGPPSSWPSHLLQSSFIIHAIFARLHAPFPCPRPVPSSPSTNPVASSASSARTRPTPASKTTSTPRVSIPPVDWIPTARACCC